MKPTKHTARFRPHELFRHKKHLEGATRPAHANILLFGVSALVAAFGDVGTVQAAPKLSVLFPFTNLRGAHPIGGLISDAAGNLYGTTANGGSHGDGTVFELSPPAFDGVDGLGGVAGLIADGAGNLFGTTYSGGPSNDGVVFELSPPAVGKTAWTETVLQTFDVINGNLPNGSVPQAGLIADVAGNLYGTTSVGGAYDSGVVFELSPAIGKKRWTETVLYSFGMNGLYDLGGNPAAGLVADGAGNLYGTTPNGGAGGSGVVFELSPPARGKSAWAPTVLYSFNVFGVTNDDGQNPAAALIFDGAGNLYGTTKAGGLYNDGVVFRLSPPPKGQSTWTETVLQSFDRANGENPYAGLIADRAGNLYGTTENGGANGDGVVFELSPPAEGQTAWTETVLHSFNITNGEYPYAGLIGDGAGSFYGATESGGHSNDGVAFKITP
jgi:uncharacterized repeat protein (TIGR03803 family)